MKKLFIFISTLLIGIIFYNVFKINIHKEKQLNSFRGYKVSIMLLRNSSLENRNSLEAWESLLREEGVKTQEITPSDLERLSPTKIATRIPLIILPDQTITRLSGNVAIWLSDYVKDGGNILLVFDATSKDINDRYRLDSNVLDNIFGMDLRAYYNYKDDSFKYGYIKFNNKKEAVEDWEIPPGKIDEDGFITGYKYGRLKYNYICFTPIAKDLKIFAKSPKDGTPLLTLHHWGKGKAFAIALPLGYLKSIGDEMLLRGIVRSIILKYISMPHLVNVPNGIGTFVINWHIDSGVEHTTFPWLYKRGFFRDINQSFHITAGPFRDHPGDGRGFDANNSGKELVKLMQKLGTVGSHGGWAHNWFSSHLEKGLFTPKEVFKYVKMNNEALEQVVHHKIIEYSAPDGVFPPYIMIPILKKLGMICYYYVGDTGSAPNRTFYKGKMLSDSIIAFPVMTFGRVASMFEMHRDGWSRDRVRKEYIGMVDYVANHQNMRLWYSHPYDIHDEPYINEVIAFFKHIKELQRQKKLQTYNMADATRFIQKFWNVKQDIELKKDTFNISISSKDRFPNGLLFAIPKKFQGREIKVDKYIKKDSKYYYISIKNENNSSKVNFNFRVGDK